MVGALAAGCWASTGHAMRAISSRAREEGDILFMAVNYIISAESLQDVLSDIFAADDGSVTVELDLGPDNFALKT